MRLPSRTFALALVGGVVVVPTEAQAQSRIVVQSARRDTLVAEGGAAVTAVFDVHNTRNDSVRAEPRVVVPAGWSVVIGSAPFAVSPKAHELWLVGVAPASTTPAGTYIVRAGIAVGRDSIFADSVLVTVPERRGVDVYLGDAPSYAMAGDGYPVSAFIHNRGNVATTFSLQASSSLGAVPSFQGRSVTVAPGATATVSGRVTNERAGLGWGTHENVVELRAQDQGDSSVTSAVSLRTTIVPRSRRWLDQLSTMPAQLMVRSVGANSGVSPASLSGGGQLSAESNTQVDFLFRAPVSGPSLFGERDEYRIAVTADRYRVRLGDNLYGFSQLTSSWISGFGAEARGDAGGVTAGAYVKEDRSTHTPGSERAIVVGTSTQAPLSMSIIGVDRTGASASARMAAFTSQARVDDHSLVELEGAMSDSAGTRGEAHRVRVSGDYTKLSYDVSLTRGTPEFAGRDHGQTTGHAGFTARLVDWASLTANTSTLSYIPTLDVLGYSRVRSTSVETSMLGDRLAVAYEQMTRADSGTFATLGGGQRGARVRASLPLAWADLFADVAGGTAQRADGLDARYSSFSMTLHAPLERAGSLELFVQRSAGMLFETSGLNAAATAMLHLPRSTNLLVSAYGNLPTGQSRLYYGQIDAELGHTLANGMTLVVRDRLMNSAWRVTAPTSNLFFVELRAPLKIPTGISRPTGLARGRIVDEETGRGIGGVLVRLGPEAAVTDAQGRVAFASLAPGRYHASVDGANSSRVSDALLTGDVSVDVAQSERRPVDFALSLVRGGQVRVNIRQLDFATTLATASPDPLIDAGGLSGAMLALIGARDTIYQVTNQDGVADFRDVPVGRWTVRLIAAELPEAHALDDDEHPVVVRARERANVGLRVVPRRKAVQFVPPPEVIVARPTPKQ